MQELHIERASLEDADAIFALYRSLIGMPFGTWSEEYPSRELVLEDRTLRISGDGCEKL